MISKLPVVCLGLACLIMIFPASAEAENGSNLFAGFSAGQTKLGAERLSVISNADYDDEDYGYRISGGVKFDNGLILGYAYNDFGTAEFNSANGGRYTLDGVERTSPADFRVETLATSHGPFIAYDIRLTALAIPWHREPPFSVTPKAGLHHWEIETNSRGSTASFSLSDQGTHGYYGVDLTYKVNNSMSLMLGYDRYRMSGDNYDYLSLGTRIKLY